MDRPAQQVQTRFTSDSEFCAKVDRQGPPITQKVIGARTAGKCDTQCAERSVMHSEQEKTKPEARFVNAKVVEEVNLIDL
jgi:hypothetical protein